MAKGKAKRKVVAGKPVIAFVAPRCCIRVIKQAIVLRDLGYEVHLLTESMDKKPASIFYKIYYYTTVEDLEFLILNLHGLIDLWVVHNEPNYPATLIRETLPESRIVIDIHDSNYWYNDSKVLQQRFGESLYWHEEDTACACADGFVVPSKSAMTDMRTRTKKPVAWLPPALPRKHYLYNGVDLLGGVVSQGGLVAPTKESLGRSCRDYTLLFSEIAKYRHLFVYSPSITFDKDNPLDKHYFELGNGNLRLGRLNYNELLLRLGSHTWNLVGNIEPTSEHVWKYAMPNKFFDAMASGTPSVVFRCTQVKEIVDLFDIGIYVDTVEEFMSRWDEHREKRINLMLVRKNLCMEAFIHQLTNLYDEVLR